ncbi:hypothetical protein DPMN_094503 [Dreissena polymorpha]|uniref:Uncharacterized protein n=1 Tax=Dreissena polymorpha TaxID=45954 RepID=A0A9D4R2Q7_DREPO|nr:hypothetical protein DPMN_094503 [Dreissena polymorpha]
MQSCLPPHTLKSFLILQTVISALSQQPTSVDTLPTPAEKPTNELQIVDENGEPVNWQDETRYCLCNQVSYCDMVGCDNDDVCMHICSLIVGKFIVIWKFLVVLMIIMMFACPYVG